MNLLDSRLAEMRSTIELALGDGCKVQILGGNVIVSPLARNLHMLIVTAVRRALDRGCDPDEYIVTERVEFVVDAFNSPQPDIAVIRCTAAEKDLEATASPIADALLVVEVTSPSNSGDDRKWGPKYKAYAKGFVPIYLLIDPQSEDGPSMTLFTEPNGTRFVHETTVPFGEVVWLPEPFEAVVIDSGRFPVPIP